MSDIRMIPIAELQKKFPTDPPPSSRWISSKAKQHGLGAQYGKFFLVREDFIERYHEKTACPVSDEKPRKMERSLTRGGLQSRTGKLTGRSDTSPLSEALALARSPKPVQSASSSKGNTTSAQISRFPKTLTTVSR